MPQPVFNKMKKFLSIILAVLLSASVLLSFASCNGNEDVSDGTENNDQPQTTSDENEPETEEPTDGETAAVKLDGKTAMTVGDFPIEALEYKFNYESSINSFYNSYYQYLSFFGVDFSKPLNEQQYDETMSWADYFANQTNGLLVESYYLYADAKANGFELTAEQQAEFESEMENTTLYITNQGYEPDEYIKTVFGEEMTMDKYRQYVWNNLYVYDYYLLVNEGFVNQKADYDTYYENNKITMDGVDFYAYYFSYTVPEETTEGDESYKDEARAAAQAMLDYLNAADDPSAVFEQYVYDNCFTDEDKASYYEDIMLGTDMKYSELIEQLGSWLFDEARAKNDTECIDYGAGFYVLTFMNRGLYTYNTVDVRHILMTTGTVDSVYLEDGETVDEDATAAAQATADAEALASLEAAYDLWKAGEATEESFASLAEIYSQDTGSSSNGGLCNDCKYDEYVAEFEGWIFDEARKPGDTEIIKTSYGYHLMYFIGESTPAWELEADTALKKEAYNNYYLDCAGKYTVTYNDEVIDEIKAS